VTKENEYEITIPDRFSFENTKILICNTLHSFHIEMYIGKNGDYYHIILKPNLYMGLYTQKIEGKSDFIPSVIANEKQFYGPNCENDRFLAQTDIPTYQLVHFKKVDKSYYAKIYAKWGFPLVKQNFKNILYPIINENFDIEKTKKFYPIIPFSILCNGLLKYYEQIQIQIGISQRVKDLIKKDYNKTNPDQIIKAIYLNDIKVLIVIHHYKKERYIIWNFVIPDYLHTKFEGKNAITVVDIQKLRYTNNLRSLYDLDFNKLQKIIKTIENVKIDGKLILDKKFQSLYCNDIIGFYMSSFHIHILSYQFYIDSLYKDKMNIIKSMRLLSIYNVIENFKFPDFYKSHNKLLNYGFLFNSNLF